jgi:hypothetical protein
MFSESGHDSENIIINLFRVETVEYNDIDEKITNDPYRA